MTGSNQSNDKVQRLVDAPMARFGRIDVLVNSLPEKEEFRSRIPIGRHGQVEEIAGTISFLAPDAAGYISEQNLRVDGGTTRSV